MLSPALYQVYGLLYRFLRFNGKIVKLVNRLDYFNGKDSNENTLNLARTINDMIENEKDLISMSKNAKKILNTRNNAEIFKEWEKILYE